VAHVHRKLWRQKPPPSVQIDWGHPLSSLVRAAFVPQSGRMVDLVSGLQTGTIANADAIRSQGQELNVSGTTGGVYALTPEALKLQRVSLLVVGDTLGATTVRRAMCGATVSGSDSPPYSSYEIVRKTDNSVEFVTNNTATYYNPASSAGVLADNAPFCIGLARGASDMRGYVAGRLVASASFSGACLYQSTSRMAFGYSFSSISQASIGISAAVVFADTLSAAAWETLNENPWQIFQPQRRGIYADLGAGGVTGTSAITLDGATTAASGWVEATGDGAITLDGATVAGTGAATDPVTGAGAITLDGATVAGVGGAEVPAQHYSGVALAVDLRSPVRVAVLTSPVRVARISSPVRVADLAA
jgi:hypothetical protein